MRRSIGLLSLPSLSRIKTVISILACSPNLTHWRWVIVPEKSPAAEMASSGIVSVAALSVPLGLNCDCQCIVTGGVTSPIGVRKLYGPSELAALREAGGWAFIQIQLREYV